MSNNLDGNTADGNATDANAPRASVDYNQVQNAKGAESKGSEDLIPKDITTRVSRWLQQNNVPQKFFAQKVLNQLQGSFLDYRTKAPLTMPKSCGRGIWKRLQQLLDSEEEQKELRELTREGKLNKSFISFKYRLCYVLYKTQLTLHYVKQHEKRQLAHGVEDKNLQKNNTVKTSGNSNISESFTKYFIE